MARSRMRNFFGKILNAKCAMASLPPALEANATGVVLSGASQGQREQGETLGGTARRRKTVEAQRAYADTGLESNRPTA